MKISNRDNNQGRSLLFRRSLRVIVGMLMLLPAFLAGAIDVSVTTSQGSAAPGDNIYHRIVITNTDGVTRSNVELSVIAPANTTFIDPLPLETSGCSNACDSTETALWNLGDIASGDSKVIILPLVINAGVADGTSISLTASVSYTGIGTAETDTANSSVETSVITQLHLAATKQVVSAGEEVNLEVSYGNTGSLGIASPQVKALVPVGTTFVSATDSGTLIGNEVVWDIATLNIGRAGKVFYTVKIGASDSNGVIYDLTSEINDGSNVLQTSNESIVVRNDVKLTLTSTVMGDISQPNKDTYYRYVIANNGLVDIAGVNLNQMTAERTTHIDALPLEGSGCSNACDSLEWALWDLGTIKAGESKVIVLPINRASPIAGEALESHVIVTDSSGAYTLGLRPTVIASDDSTLELIISPDKQVIGASESNGYQLSFGNISSSTYTNLDLSIQVPNSLSFISASDGGVFANGEVTWDLGTLSVNSGGIRFVTLESTASVADGDVIVLNSSLSSGGSDLLRSSDSLVIKNDIKLTLTSTVMGDISQPNKDTYYRYVIANNGLVDIAGVNLNQMTAERTTHIDGLPLEGSGCSNACDSLEWALWDLGTIKAGESKVIVLSTNRANPIAGEALESHVIVTDSSGAYTLGMRPTIIASDDSTLELIISPDKQVIGASESNRYQLSFGNISSSAYTNLDLAIQIPDSLSFVSASDGGVFANGEVTWDLGTLSVNSGGFRFVTLESTAGVADGEVIVLDSSLSSGGSDLLRSSDSLVIKNDVKLTLTSTVMGDISQPDKDSYYRYVIANNGAVDIAGVNLNQMTAERTTHIDGLPLESSGCSNSCDSLEWALWDLGTIKAGESKVIVLPTNRANPIAGEALESHVIVTDSSGAYTLGMRPTIIASDDSTLELIISPDKQVIGASELNRYQLSFGNISNSAYTNLDLAIQIPSSLNFISASDGGVFANSEVTWDLGTLSVNSGGARFVTLESTASVIDGEVIVLNTSLSSGGADLLRSSDSLVIKNDVKLTLTSTVMGDISQPDKDSYYRYVIANNGAVDIAGVNLNQMTAERTTHIDGLPLEGSGCSNSCDSKEWALWDLGTIKAGESKVIVLPINRAAPIAGEALESHVIVTDSNGAYTIGMRPTVIASDLISPQIAISTDRSLHQSSDSQTFTISVGNPTATALSNALVVVEIPDNYSFVSASGLNEVKGGKVFWPIGNVQANQWLNETVTLQIDSGLDNGSVLKLDARLENDTQLSLIAFASISTTINSQSSMILTTDLFFTAPVAEGDVINLTIDASNETGVQIANVEIYSMTPTNTTASNTGTTSGCSGSCDDAEWAFWDLGVIDGGTSDNRVFIQTISSGTNAPEAGNLLISNTYLTHASSPTLEQALVDVVGVGTEFTINANHDSDNDGIPDWWEIRYGYDRLDSADASTDDDADGSDNLEEYLESTDPTDQDSDNDGILDGPDTDPLNDNDPTANAGADASAREASSVQLDGSASADGDDPTQTVGLIYAWSQTSGTSVTLDDVTSATPTFTAPNTAPEDLIFELTVEDSTGNTATDSITISVSADNPPTADAGTDQSVGSGDLVTLNGSNSSDDFDTQEQLTFAWTELTSTGITLSDASAVSPTFTAPDLGTNGGSIRMQLIVTDTAAQSSSVDEVIINIVPGVAPVADAGPDQDVNQSLNVQLDASNSSDSDGTIATYVWAQTDGESVTLSDANISQPTFTSPAVDGALTFMLTVTDNDGLSNDDEVIINVGSDPIAVCEAGPAQDVNEFDASDVLSVVNLDASNSSISSGTISYMWTQILGSSVTLTSPNNVATDLTVNEVSASGESYTFEVTCTSDLGTQSTDEVIINVMDTNRAPISDAGDAQQVDEGDTVILDGSGSSDIDGDTITYLWTLVSSSNGTGVTLDSTTVESPTFVAPDVDDATGETFTFSLTVNDGSLSNVSEVIITVMGSDTPPTANAGSNQSVNESTTVTLDGSNSSDVEGAVTYLWSQVSGTQVTLNSTTQAQPTFSAPSVAGGSITLTFELTVTDSASNTASDQVIITVNDTSDTSGGGGSSSGGGSIFLLLGLLGGVIRLRRKQ
ncbi:MAG: hypothetical protein COA86_07715 [Kangiella sp.]|nr:MAG: hypothetical protein COA86_07715 [Kangiella sp.]